MNLRPDNYRRWDLPAQGWSGAKHIEDNIRIIREDGKWIGFTEVDQCVHRDLDDDEIASVRREFNLDEEEFRAS